MSLFVQISVLPSIFRLNIPPSSLIPITREPVNIFTPFSESAFSSALSTDIDLSSVTPRLLTDDLARRVNLLVTMGCGEECPYVPGVERRDWALTDPKGRPVEEVRAIRDDIRTRVELLVDERGWK